MTISTNLSDIYPSIQPHSLTTCTDASKSLVVSVIPREFYLSIRSRRLVIHFSPPPTLLLENHSLPPASSSHSQKKTKFVGFKETIWLVGNCNYYSMYLSVCLSQASTQDSQHRKKPRQCGITMKLRAAGFFPLTHTSLHICYRQSEAVLPYTGIFACFREIVALKQGSFSRRRQSKFLK